MSNFQPPGGETDEFRIPWFKPPTCGPLSQLPQLTPQTVLETAEPGFEPGQSDESARLCPGPTLFLSDPQVTALEGGPAPVASRSPQRPPEGGVGLPRAPPSQEKAQSGATKKHQGQLQGHCHQLSPSGLPEPLRVLICLRCGEECGLSPVSLLLPGAAGLQGSWRLLFPRAWPPRSVTQQKTLTWCCVSSRLSLLHAAMSQNQTPGENPTQAQSPGRVGEMGLCLDPSRLPRSD